jgi:Flp pilus assembly secretin CpaC
MAMRRSVLAFAVAAATLVAAAAQAQTLVAPIDQSISVSFPAAARDIVVGNPQIVDVNLLDSRNAVLIGKSYGVTSVQVFDTNGRSIFARQVVVSSANDNRVSYFRGGVETSFACAPRCERTATDPAPATAPAAPAATP